MSSKRIAVHSDEPGDTSDDRKRAQIPIRTSALLRQRLVEAATKNDRSLTQEIEQRLERSLELEDQFGRADTVGLVHAIVGAIEDVEVWTGAHWSEDQVTFHAALEAISSIVRDRQPRRWINQEQIEQTMAELEAAKLVRDVITDDLSRLGALTPPELSPQLKSLLDAGSAAAKTFTRTRVGGLFGAPLLPPGPPSPAALSSEDGKSAGGLLASFLPPTHDAPAKSPYQLWSESVRERGLISPTGDEQPQEVVEQAAALILELEKAEADVAEKRALFLEAYRPQSDAAKQGAALIQRKRQLLLQAAIEAGKYRHGA